ncbi:MAG: hypothetical protein ACOC9J_00435 [Persicimonas sp.]
MTAIVLAVALSVGAATASAEPAGEATDEPTELPWYVPDLAKVQFAGNIGFLSAAAGYSYLNQKLETEVFFGFVPPFVGNKAVYMASLKQHYVPWEFGWGEALHIAPLYVGIFSSYTFGSEFEIFPDNWAGGKDFYTEQSALRLGPLIGGRLRADIEPYGPVDDIGAYWELNVSDLGLKAYFSNTGYFDFYDVLTLGVGVRVGFR